MRTRRFAPMLGALLAISLSVLPAAPSGAQSPMGDPMDVGLELIAEGLTSPVALMEAPDGSGRLFVVDQAGLIRIITPEGELLAEPFLDVRDRMVALQAGFDERGLLGLAFHPEYASNGRFFVYYSAPLREGAPAGFNHTSHISEFTVSDDADRADPSSERILLQVDEPQFNHNAGALAFGPDGYLYISLGDGGGANDVGLGHVEDWYADNAGGNGQDVEQNLLGNILRIDVDGGDPYGIPADNPFVGTVGLDEIWAYGLRNPYRMSFDMATGDLFVSDAGQALWEEVSLVTRGANLGWNVKEGTHCFDAENPTQSPEECPDEVLSGPRAGDPLVDPVIEYANGRQPGGIGLVVVGGFVYRSSTLPQLRGRYVFGDWSTSFGNPDGTLLVAKSRMKGLWQIQELRVATSPTGRLDHFLLGFGQDMAGDVYVLGTERTGPTGATGKVWKLVRPSGR
ncbi:MAG TPA: PQQ-dependent sugar dehydrogenase [Actinomycetota bacterium]|nr:PQQ-dependent sugar dehydrogenase [Actinomycetota bacterium]